MANPSLSVELNTINSLTNPLIAQKIADNITGRIPLFHFLNKIGHKEFENGGTDYRFPVFKELPNATVYSGLTSFVNTEKDLVSTALLYRKLFTQDITLSGEKLLQNSGDDQTAVVNYITAQVEMAEESMKNTLAGSTYGIFSSQADSDLGITGLQTMLPDSTSTGTYAGLSRATYSYWRHNSDTVSTGFDTDGLVSLTALRLACQRGDEAPTVIIMTRTSYANFIRELTGTLTYNQPSPKTQFMEYGAEHINFGGAIVIFDDGVPENRAYVLNLKYLKLLVHSKRDMAIRDFITPSNQDAIIGRMYWAGNLVCNNLARQGILQGLPDTWA